MFPILNSIFEILQKLLISLNTSKTKRRYLRQKFAFKKKLNEYSKLHVNFACLEKALSKKIAAKRKVRLCFTVMYDNFVAEALYTKVSNDEFFDPFILVIPDTLRGDKNMFYQLDKTYKELSKKYNNVFLSYDYHKKEFIDFHEKCDLLCFSNPYDHMTHHLYTIDYFSKKDVLAFFISYGFMPDLYARKYIINQEALNKCWKVFVDTSENLEIVKSSTDIKGRNAILTGYCKMDMLNMFEKCQRKRKKIILAPHHTVGKEFEETFPLSNFIIYSDFFLELPAKYPEIDFVFRPHPLLFITLKTSDIWGEEKTNDYLKKITSYINVEYQEGGDYFDTFINSDGIIHDCSSFIVEYLFTGNPACYLLRNKEFLDKYFVSLGKNCLNNYYMAFNESDIIAFIENVVIKEEDTLFTERVNYVKKNLMLNYPNVSDKIIEHIKDCLV